MTDLHRLTANCGVKLFPRSAKHPCVLQPKQTFCRHLLSSLAKTNGEDHVCMVLELIISSPHNQAQLYADVVSGVSKFLLEGRYESRDTPMLGAYMANIDLGALRAEVKEVDLPHAPLRIADRLASQMQGRAWFQPSGNLAPLGEAA